MECPAKVEVFRPGKGGSWLVPGGSVSSKTNREAQAAEAEALSVRIVPPWTGWARSGCQFVVSRRTFLDACEIECYCDLLSSSRRYFCGAAVATRAARIVHTVIDAQLSHLHRLTPQPLVIIIWMKMNDLSSFFYFTLIHSFCPLYLHSPLNARGETKTGEKRSIRMVVWMLVTTTYSCNLSCVVCLITLKIKRSSNYYSFRGTAILCIFSLGHIIFSIPTCFQISLCDAHIWSTPRRQTKRYFFQRRAPLLTLQRVNQVRLLMGSVHLFAKLHCSFDLVLLYYC